MNKTMEQENKRTKTGRDTYSYRNLDVWKRAQELTLKIIQLASQFPKSPTADSLARQIIRSGSSIGANIAEGHGRFSLGAFRNHLQIARGSACETDSWLYLLERAGLITTDAEVALHKECNIVIAALTNRILALGKKMNESGMMVREDEMTYEVNPSNQPRE